MLTVTNLSCTRQTSVVFSNLSFTVTPGNLLLIKGSNGAGKSTLLKSLAGLLTPVSGDIRWEQPYSSHYLTHHNGLRLDLTVKENLTLALALQGMSFNPKTSRDILEKLNLNTLLDKTPRTLSAGQQRRVALSLLWLIPKKAWLLDEPLTALDASSEKIFLAHLEEHLMNQGIALITTHQSLILPSLSYQTLTL